MKSVRCNFKGVSSQDSAEFSAQEALLLISIGREAHEGERFAATVALMADAFASTTISVYDSIQRFTLALDQSKDPEALRSVAADAGLFWHERNSEAIEQLTNLNQVIYWQDWLQHPLYQDTFFELLSEKQKRPSYDCVFAQSVQKYLDKYESRLVNPVFYDRKRSEAFCMEYIVEECAVFALWIKLGYKYEVYPGVHNDAINATRTIFSEKYGCFLRPLTLRFRNTRRPGPQKILLRTAVSV